LKIDSQLTVTNLYYSVLYTAIQLGSSLFTEYFLSINCCCPFVPENCLHARNHEDLAFTRSNVSITRPDRNLRHPPAGHFMFGGSERRIRTWTGTRLPNHAGPVSAMVRLRVTPAVGLGLSPNPLRLATSRRGLGKLTTELAGRETLNLPISTFKFKIRKHTDLKFCLGWNLNRTICCFFSSCAFSLPPMPFLKNAIGCQARRYPSYPEKDPPELSEVAR